ncbi:transcription initiation factor TFIID subunit 10 [Trichonephila clavipes]|nr:transcription initiation factor TFIID subunit 10 [Trichonephila clavipes]
MVQEKKFLKLRPIHFFPLAQPIRKLLKISFSYCFIVISLEIMNQSPKLEPVASSSGVPITPLVFSQSDTSSTTNKTKQSLSEFVSQLDNYTSTIPDPVAAHYMRSAGFSSNDPKIIKLISIAAQKFLSDIASDSLEQCKMKNAEQTKKTTKDKKYVLTMEDLTTSLEEYGISVKKPPYLQ